MFVFEDVSNGILTNITFEINKGEKVIVFGPSGAGKSTLLHMFNRLHDPREGTITFNHNLLDSYPVPSLRRKVGLVMQEPNLFPGTVLDNIKFGPSLENKWNEEKAYALLNDVQLPEDFLRKDIDELSGGEQQRVSLARTLANEPDVLLLDEPTSALDQRTTEEIENVLLHLVESHKLTVIMVTHNLMQAKRLGTRGLFLSEGKLMEDGALPDMLETPDSDQLKNFLS